MTEWTWHYGSPALDQRITTGSSSVTVEGFIERDPDELPEPTDPQGPDIKNDEIADPVPDAPPPDDGQGEIAAGLEPTEEGN